MRHWRPPHPRGDSELLPELRQPGVCPLVAALPGLPGLVATYPPELEAGPLTWATRGPLMEGIT